MTGKLSGKVAVVTGSSRGIGRGIAMVLAEQGATVYVTGRSLEKGAYYLPGTIGETAEECSRRGRDGGTGGIGIPVKVDHGDEAEVAALFARVKREQGRLDILVNNAFQLSDDLIVPKPFWEKPTSNLEMIDVGVKSNFTAAWHAAQIMVPQRSGLIVAISGYVSVTYTFGVVFGTAKSAVDRMAHDMAIELKPHNVASLALWPNLTFGERALHNLERNPDMKKNTVTNPDIGCTVEFPGRVVAALGGDADVMARSGGSFIIAEVAQEYGITDIDGRVIPSVREERGAPYWMPV